LLGDYFAGLARTRVEQVFALTDELLHLVVRGGAAIEAPELFIPVPPGFGAE